MKMDLTRIASRVAAVPTSVSADGGDAMDNAAGEADQFTGLGEWKFEGEADVANDGITETLVGKTDAGVPFKGRITVYTRPGGAGGLESTGWDYKAIEGPEPAGADVVQDVLDAFDKHGL